MDERVALLLAVAAGVVTAAVFGSLYSAPLVDERLLSRYIGDEVWYVSASRNLAYLFGLEPTACREAYATLFYSNETLASIVASRFGFKLLTSATAVVAPWPPPPALNASTTRCCYSYPDAEGIGDYLNLEHPPLAKLIEALVMHFLGDCPRLWRLPVYTLSLVAVYSTVYTAVVVAYRLSRRLAPCILAAVTSASLVVFASSFRVLAGVVMLEGFAAGFGMASLALLASGYERAAVILATLSTLSKYTGVAYLAAVLLYSWLVGGLRRAASRLVLAVLAALIVYAPLAAALGPGRVVHEAINGLNWFLESRPGGPPTSTPLDWLMGRGESPLTFNPDLVARPNPVLAAGGLAASAVLLVASTLEPILAVAAPTLIFYLVMALVYAGGNHTLYAFYTAVYEPAAALSISLLAVAVHERLVSRRRLAECIAAWGSRREAVALARILTGGYAVAALAATGLAHGFGSGTGLLAVRIESRLDALAVTASAVALAATSVYWRRVGRAEAAAVVLATPGLLPATILLLTMLVLVEAPGMAVAALAAYPTLLGATAALLRSRSLRSALAVLAVYAALRLVGVAPPPPLAELLLAPAAVVLARLGAEPLAYLAAALYNPGYALLAAALMAREAPVAAILAAAGYKHPQALLLSLLFAAAAYLGRLRRDRSVV